MTKIYKVNASQLPKEISYALNNLNNPINPGLRLQKLQPWSENTDGWSLNKTDFHREFAEKAGFDKPLNEAYTSRWKQLVHSQNGELIEDLVTANRLIVGLGITSTSETNIALHHIYGFPVIPASSLKGLCSAICFMSIASQLVKDFEATNISLKYLLQVIKTSGNEQEASWQKLREFSDKVPPIHELLSRSDVKSFRDMFGTTNQLGNLIFFDAIMDYSESNPWDPDVMTPHYSDYYSGSNFPDDTQKPIIIPFLTVKPGVKFNFGIGVKDSAHINHTTLAVQWLRFALCHIGVGAKTNRGYGQFKLNKADIA